MARTTSSRIGIGSSSQLSRGSTPEITTNTATTIRLSPRLNELDTATDSGTTMRGNETLRTSDSRSTTQETQSPVTSAK